MKKTAIFVFICLFLCRIAYSITDSDPAMRELQITDGDLHVVLKAYAHLVDRELEETPQVEKLDKKINVHAENLSLQSMIKLLEKSIKKQAGVTAKANRH